MTANAKRPNERPLIEQLAALAGRLGAARLSLSVSDESVNALLAAGGRRSRTVIQHDDEKPYTIEKATLVLASVVLEAHRPSRPASPGEARALESDEAYFYLGNHKAVELKNVD